MALSPRKKNPSTEKELYYNILYRIERIEQALRIMDYSNKPNQAKQYVDTLP